MAIKNKATIDTNLNSIQEEMKEMKEYKTVIRGIGQTANYAMGVYTGAEVDAYISKYLEEGWQLHSVQPRFTMNNPENPSVPMAYVFVWTLVR